MNLRETKYSKFILVQEMMEAAAVVRNFNPGCTEKIAGRIGSKGRLLLTGEGSSRIFPAKNAVCKGMKWGMKLHICTEGCRQSALYDLSGYAVFCASNSGRTKEAIQLAKKIAASGNKNCFCLSAHSNSPLEKECAGTFILNCGYERAVAATKSVIEQALFYESILRHISRRNSVSLDGLSGKIEQSLTLDIDPAIVEIAARASTIYFAGYNDGVAEELALKANEIIRKRSDFLEGTYAVHGIEEAMSPDDVVFIIDPIEDEVEKFRDVLVRGIGLNVIAISSRKTSFPTIILPEAGEMDPYVYLCAGWNLLVEIGVLLGIDIDRPERARKIGNEFTP